MRPTPKIAHFREKIHRTFNFVMAVHSRRGIQDKVFGCRRQWRRGRTGHASNASYRMVAALAGPLGNSRLNRVMADEDCVLCLEQIDTVSLLEREGSEKQ